MNSEAISMIIIALLGEWCIQWTIVVFAIAEVIKSNEATKSIITLFLIKRTS